MGQKPSRSMSSVATDQSQCDALQPGGRFPAAFGRSVASVGPIAKQLWTHVLHMLDARALWSISATCVFFHDLVVTTGLSWCVVEHLLRRKSTTGTSPQKQQQQQQQQDQGNVKVVCCPADVMIASSDSVLFSRQSEFHWAELDFSVCEPEEHSLEKQINLDIMRTMSRGQYYDNFPIYTDPVRYGYPFGVKEASVYLCDQFQMFEEQEQRRHSVVVLLGWFRTSKYVDKLATVLNSINSSADRLTVRQPVIVRLASPRTDNHAMGADVDHKPVPLKALVELAQRSGAVLAQLNTYEEQRDLPAIYAMLACRLVAARANLKPTKYRGYLIFQ